MSSKCGYIALVGCPNAGKSTLLNSLIGSKLAAVSKRPQTTRNRILGIETVDNVQMLFLDTPGMNLSANCILNSTMNQVANQVTDEADVVLYLVDGIYGLGDFDKQFLTRITAGTSKVPVYILISKIDRLKKAAIAKIEDTVTEFVNSLPEENQARIVDGSPFSLSAKRIETVDYVKNKIQDHLPEGPFLFDSEEVTDISEQFLTSELIREQLFRQLGQELPYGSAVIVDGITKSEKIVKVLARVIVNRATHKGIVLGKKGAKIKDIGMASRESLEHYFDQKVFLDLHVEVQSDWINKGTQVAEYGNFHESMGV